MGQKTLTNPNQANQPKPLTKELQYTWETKQLTPNSNILTLTLTTLTVTWPYAGPTGVVQGLFYIFPPIYDLCKLI
jgi:hypothetical protein